MIRRSPLLRFLQSVVATVAATFLAPSARADGEIVIRLSYKVIVNPDTGGLPTSFSQSSVDNAVAQMNDLLRSYQRGYQFETVGPVRQIGNFGGNSPPSPSAWYASIIQLQPFEVFQEDVADSPSLYAVDPTAVNIFINEGNIDPSCNQSGGSVVVVNGAVSANGRCMLHHLSHFFNLCNTQGCSCNCCTGGSTCTTVPGNDNIADTLPDLPCWSQDQIAQNTYGFSYASLGAALQNEVDNAFRNIMSHHGTFNCGQGIPSDRMTELQLDRWTDSASTTRAALCDGRTFFVDHNAPTSQNGRSTNPYDLISEGVTAAAAAAGSDILMIRTGTYPEHLTISTPLTLRTPRGQTARIGQ